MRNEFKVAILAALRSDVTLVAACGSTAMIKKSQTSGNYLRTITATTPVLLTWQEVAGGGKSYSGTDVYSEILAETIQIDLFGINEESVDAAEQALIDTLDESTLDTTGAFSLRIKLLSTVTLDVESEGNRDFYHRVLDFSIGNTHLKASGL